MKTTVPEALKADLPQTFWGKVLSATPVVLAVVSTMLAGLSSSEMTRAQYARSMAAQLQSKAGDQWSFFQAKRLRSALQGNTLDLLLTSAAPNRLNPAALMAVLAGTPAAALAESAAGREALGFLAEGRLPQTAAAPELETSIRAALAAVEQGESDSVVIARLAEVTEPALEAALRRSRDHTLAFDEIMKPTLKAIDETAAVVERGQADAALRRDFVAARLGFHARRYDAEARLNQSVASLYELQVKKTNVTAERHHRRSQRFFFGMLAAQLGVIVSTLAVAARKRNLLWSFAAAAGILAVGFAIYVYLYV